MSLTFVYLCSRLHSNSGFWLPVDTDPSRQVFLGIASMGNVSGVSNCLLQLGPDVAVFVIWIVRQHMGALLCFLSFWLVNKKNFFLKRENAFQYLCASPPLMQKFCKHIFVHMFSV